LITRLCKRSFSQYIILKAVYACISVHEAELSVSAFGSRYSRYLITACRKDDAHRESYTWVEHTRTRFFPVPSTRCGEVPRSETGSSDMRQSCQKCQIVGRGTPHHLTRNPLHVQAICRVRSAGSALRLEATLIWGAFHLGFGETLLTLKIY